MTYECRKCGKTIVFVAGNTLVGCPHHPETKKEKPKIDLFSVVKNNHGKANLEK